MITKEMCLGSLIEFCDNNSVWKDIKLAPYRKGTDYSRVDVNGKYYSFMVLGETEKGDIAMDEIINLMSFINGERNEKHDLTLVLPNKPTYREIIRQEQYNYNDLIDVWFINTDASIAQMDNDEVEDGGFRNEGE